MFCIRYCFFIILSKFLNLLVMQVVQLIVSFESLQIDNAVSAVYCISFLHPLHRDLLCTYLKQECFHSYRFGYNNARMMLGLIKATVSLRIVVVSFAISSLTQTLFIAILESKRGKSESHLNGPCKF